MKEKILLINDEQLIEGFIGAFGTAINSIVFKYIFRVNSFLSIVIAWIFTWFLRKVVMNLYKTYKTNKNKKGYGFFLNKNKKGYGFFLNINNFS